MQMRGSVKSAREVDLSEFDLQPLEELDPAVNGIVQKVTFQPPSTQISNS